MYYAIISILAIVIHLIINRDVLRHSGDHSYVPARREYRDYIFGMLIFFFTDVLWGLFTEYNLAVPLYVDSVLSFISMMGGFMLWTRYVVAYMNEHTVFSKLVSIAGIARKRLPLGQSALCYSHPAGAAVPDDVCIYLRSEVKEQHRGKTPAPHGRLVRNKHGCPDYYPDALSHDAAVLNGLLAVQLPDAFLCR